MRYNAINNISEEPTMTDKVSTATAYMASGSAIIFGLSANEFAAMVGAAAAMLTFFANIWFKYQHLKLAQARLRSDEELMEQL